ncbi:MAG: phage major tail tube protein [Oscillospiraceae bacterium]|nr:phage major tail tube protein [Oscillospiraceae bacterium]
MIPDKLTNFICYDAGNEMLGIVDVTLPNLNYMTESMGGAGIAGEIDSPTKGHFQSLTTAINWRVLFGENVVYCAPETYHYAFMGNVQSYDEGSGEYRDTGIKVVMRCIPKNATLGTMGVAVQMGTSVEYEIIYLLISVNRRAMVEIDKLNFVCTINGRDYMSEVRRNIGRD